MITGVISKELIPWVIALIVVIAVTAAVRYVVQKLKRLKNKVLYSAESAIAREITPYAKDLATGIFEAAMDNTPKVRSTGGATSAYLERVLHDFKDFHAEDADTDVKTFIIEFLQIKYGRKQNFEKAKVSERVLIHIGDKTTSSLSNIKINQIAISGYQKSLNSATLRYRVSAGYNQNGMRKEKLYEVEYTLQLRNEYDASAFLKCENCGAPLKESDGVCPYCGMKHIRDTISNWVVTDVVEK